MTLPVELSSLPPVMRASEAATLLKLSENRLAKLRISGDGPAFVKAGKNVRYTRESILQWLSANTRRSTSDSGMAA